MKKIIAIILSLTLGVISTELLADPVGIARFVPHISSIPANRGEQIGLYLHERLSDFVAADIERGASLEGRVVLFVHGNSVPSVSAFDLPFGDYSWMAYLANAGFDSFAMDHQGYGYSARPKMNDPCNLDPRDQSILLDGILENTCDHSYNYLLNNSNSDVDEINSVVDYVRELRGVERVTLIGWSRGGRRIGDFAARYPEKVDRLVFFAPDYTRDESGSVPADTALIGAPMGLQTKDALINQRWAANVACDGQVESGITETIWQHVMGFDSLGSAWRPEGVMRVRRAGYWGWNAAAARRISAPSLILIGAQDGLLPNAKALYGDLDAGDNKVLVEMECATHFANWEATQYRFMHQASLEWLQHGTFRGDHRGQFSVRRYPDQNR